jgi:hypothetical protein
MANMPECDWNCTSDALEVVDQNATPFFQMIRKNPYHVVFNGIFATPSRLIAADGGFWTSPNGRVPSDFFLRPIFRYQHGSTPENTQTDQTDCQHNLGRYRLEVKLPWHRPSTATCSHPVSALVAAHDHLYLVGYSRKVPRLRPLTFFRSTKISAYNHPASTDLGA